MTQLLVATSNPGKVVELATLLKDLPCQVIGLSDLPQPLPIAAETGATFSENALMKAEEYHARTGLLTLADDSGLEVDALGGAPGIYSARYAGETATDAENVDKLLRELRTKHLAPDQRSARFRCVIALAQNGKLLGTFEGVAEGSTVDPPRGTGGFGYDP